MMPTRSIEGIERVFEAVGFETKFHDAEVLSFRLERGEKPLLGLCLLTPARRGDAEPSEADYIVWIHFEDIDDLRLEGFNYQNVLQEIVILEGAERTNVRVAGLFGVDCSFSCACGKVVSVKETTMRVGMPNLKAEGYI